MFQKKEKYKDTEPTAIDLFKDTHCSKKIGFSEPVKNAIVSIWFLFFCLLDMNILETAPIVQYERLI